METITFTAEPDKNNITFTVKSEFVKVCPKYNETKVVDLIKEYNIFKYFHNPSGPAVVDHKINHKAWFIDGKLIGVEGKQNETIDEDQLSKIKHMEQFNNKMEKVLVD